MRRNAWWLALAAVALTECSHGKREVAQGAPAVAAEEKPEPQRDWEELTRGGNSAFRKLVSGFAANAASTRRVVALLPCFDGAQAEIVQAKLHAAFVKQPKELMLALYEAQARFDDGTAFSNYAFCEADVHVSTDRLHPLVSEFMIQLKVGAGGRIRDAKFAQAAQDARTVGSGPVAAAVAEMLRQLSAPDEL